MFKRYCHLYKLKIKSMNISFNKTLFNSKYKKSVYTTLFSTKNRKTFYTFVPFIYTTTAFWGLIWHIFCNVLWHLLKELSVSPQHLLILSLNIMLNSYSSPTYLIDRCRRGVQVQHVFRGGRSWGVGANRNTCLTLTKNGRVKDLQGFLETVGGWKSLPHGI